MGDFSRFDLDMELAELGTALLPGVGSVRLSVEVLTSTRTFLRFSERFAISGEVGEDVDFSSRQVVAGALAPCMHRVTTWGGGLAAS